MTKGMYEVSFRGRAIVHGSIDRAHVMDTHLDEVMDHLIDTEEGDPRLSTADLSAKLATGEVELSITVEAESPEAATTIGLGAIRAAIHAAGGCTPTWRTTASETTTTWALEFEGSEAKAS